ncbi:hypothetical protein DYB38_002348 [Aphanomyces astaci]|uniref:Fibronectin type-III domain-containing protein n=1 Tax=Aphanomyces astaci TaxID=112090 RepID=A0A397D9H6_APHAT|nr:hypothetical protein DYB38_002348 [Aphanomyces astaci]
MNAVDEPFAYAELTEAESDEALQKALQSVLLKRKQYQMNATKQLQKELDAQARSIERAVSMAKITGALNESNSQAAPSSSATTNMAIPMFATPKSTFQDFHPYSNNLPTPTPALAVPTTATSSAVAVPSGLDTILPPPSAALTATNPMSSTSTTSTTFVGLVVVSTAFKYVPPLADSMLAAASSLHTVLCDVSLGGFLNQATKLLVNPSLVEFQTELATFETAVDPQSTFFMLVVSRVSSVDELVLTALHEQQLAAAIDRIPSQRKLLAFDVCHLQSILPPVTTKEDAPPPSSIKGRIHEDFARKFLSRLRELETQRQVARAKADHIPLKSLPATQVPVLVLEACKARSQVAIHENAGSGNAFFLRRFVDAFRGAAASPGRPDAFKNWTEDDAKFPFVYARDVVTYVAAAVQFDAYVASSRARDAMTAKDLLTVQFEEAASVRDMSQTPQLHCDVPGLDFRLGKVPQPPMNTPTPPTLVSASTTSLQVKWTMPPGDNRTPVLGYQLERKGDGPASESWTLVATRLVQTYEDVVHNAVVPPITLTATGLASDAAFRFRVRARNAGGWGHYSAPSPPLRTMAGIPNYVHVKASWHRMNVITPLL